MTDKARPASEITEGLRDWSDNRREESADAFLKLVYAEVPELLSTDKRIVANPEPPGFVNPLFGVINSDSRTRHDS